MAVLHSLIARRGSGVRLHDGPDLKLFILVGLDRSFRLLIGPRGSTDNLLLLQLFSGVV